MNTRNYQQWARHGLIMARAKNEGIKDLSYAEICRVFSEVALPDLCRRVFERLVAAGLTLDMIYRMELPPPAAGEVMTSPADRKRAVDCSRRVYILAPGGDYNHRPRMEARELINDTAVCFVYNRAEETTTIIESYG
jgi:hypothetical protein